MRDWKLEPARDLHLSSAERLRSLEREAGLVETGLHLAWWFLVRVYLSICHRLDIRGRENLPSSPPFILIANHCSHLDALVLASVLDWRVRDRIFPIAAGDTFFETPAMTAFAALLLNALPMWRRNCGPHAIPTLRRRLIEEPCAYILFPEGTRARDGRMAAFKPGLGMLVAQSSVPVVPCRIEGAFEAWPARRGFPRFRKVRLEIGRPISFESTPNHRDGWLTIAAESRDAVHSLAGRGMR